MNRIPPSWMISSLKKSHLVLGMMIANVTQTEAQDLRDGAAGWSILEIVCHVRDYQEILFERVRRMVEEDCPALKPYDEAAREAMVIEGNYNQQDMRAVYDDFCATREKLILYLSDLTADQWQRVGIHPMLDGDAVFVEVYHTISHDIDHAEQIGRVLGR
jgi:DinB superfamily